MSGAPAIELRLIKPCTDGKKGVTCEARILFEKELDGGKMCKALRGFFDALVCSEKLGVAKGEIGGKTVVVSKSGKVVVRRADDEQDAMRIVKKIRAVLSVG